MEYRPDCVSGRWDPCHVLQFIVDSRDRVVRVDTIACLQGERDVVGAFSNSRDMSIGGSFGGIVWFTNIHIISFIHWRYCSRYGCNRMERSFFSL